MSDNEGESVWGSSGALRLDSIAAKWVGLTPALYAEWCRRFPDVAVGDEMDKAAHWCVTHGANGRKANYQRFLTNWLQKEQDEADPYGARMRRARPLPRLGPEFDSVARGGAE